MLRAELRPRSIQATNVQNTQNAPDFKSNRDVSALNTHCSVSWAKLTASRLSPLSTNPWCNLGTSGSSIFLQVAGPRLFVVNCEWLTGVNHIRMALCRIPGRMLKAMPRFVGAYFSTIPTAHCQLLSAATEPCVRCAGKTPKSPSGLMLFVSTNGLPLRGHNKSP